MDDRNSWRGRFLKFVATALLGLTLISLVSPPAESAPWRGRRWARGWGGYRAYRMPYRNYAGIYPRSGYGYRPVAPRSYSSNYFYRPAAPYGYGYGGYSTRMAPAAGYYNYVPPML
jgi:hypothetical protein